MSYRYLLSLAIIATLAGCGTSAQPNAAARLAKTSAAATAGVTGTEALARFEKLPAKGLVKKAAPLRAATAVRPVIRPGISDTIAKIQMVAFTALSDADAKENWADRWAVTDAALTKIDGIRLESNQSNLAAKIGFYAARGHGYMGQQPTHENRFKVQAVTLGFLRENDQESTLAKGGDVFAMSAEMLEASTGWDQGFRVGISALTVLKENYKDRDISKACQSLLEKSCAAPTKEDAYAMMVTGFKSLAEKLR